MLVSLGVLVGAGCGGDSSKVWDRASVEDYVQARAVWNGGQAKLRGELEGCVVLQAFSSCRLGLSERLRLLDADIERRLSTLAARDDLDDHCRDIVHDSAKTFSSDQPSLTAKTVSTLTEQITISSLPGTAAMSAIWKACQPS